MKVTAATALEVVNTWALVSWSRMLQWIWCDPDSREQLLEIMFSFLHDFRSAS
jgi:hypothetical protein